MSKTRLIMARSILIADLDRHAAETLRAILEEAGFKVRAAYDPFEMAAMDMEGMFNAVVADPKFPRVEGANILDYLKTRAPGVAIIVAAGRGDGKALAAAGMEGAAGALDKPYTQDSARALSDIIDEAEKRGQFDFVNMIGRSAPMLSLYESIRSVARTGSSALIYGETGSGKELVAAAIHAISARRRKKFVTINCGALPESLLESELFGHEKGAFTGAIRTKIGKFENADGGTIFLDEIGEISPAVQLRLLKVIETGEVERVGSNRVIKTDVRMIFATNRDLSADVREGRFRQDLFYRINVFPIRTPPLRERREDIPALAGYFLSLHCARHGKGALSITPEAMGWLMGREWKGNVRELENAVERAVIIARGSGITVEDLDTGRSPGAEAAALADLSGLTHRDMTRAVMSVYEKRYLMGLLDQCGGNVAKAARRAGLDRKTVYNKLREHGIDPAGPRGRRRG